MKAILGLPDQVTSDYIDSQVKRHRDAWKRAAGKGPLLVALAKAFAMAKVDFADCPTMVHVTAKAYTIISRPQPAVLEEQN